MPEIASAAQRATHQLKDHSFEKILNVDQCLQAENEIRGVRSLQEINVNTRTQQHTLDQMFALLESKVPEVEDCKASEAIAVSKDELIEEAKKQGIKVTD